MKRTAIAMAGALAFDLGVIVVGSQAAEGPKTTSPSPQQAEAVDAFLKLDGREKSAKTIFIKIDKVNTAEACLQKIGKVIDTPQGKVCELPKTPTAK